MVLMINQQKKDVVESLNLKINQNNYIFLVYIYSLFLYLINKMILVDNKKLVPVSILGSSGVGKSTLKHFLIHG